MYPSFLEFSNYASSYQLIPVSKEYMADFETPISIFNRIVHEKNVFLLESVEGGEKWARYSFIGKNPFLIATLLNKTISLKGTINKNIHSESPLKELERIISQYKSPIIKGLPPFTGGAVGYFSYNVTRYFENLPEKDGVHETPDACFLFCDEIIVYDHKHQKIIIIANVKINKQASHVELQEQYIDAEKRIDKMYEKLTGLGSKIEQKNGFAPVLTKKELATPLENRTHSDTTRDEFHQMVKKAKDYIKAGDIFQVVLSQKWKIDTYATPFETYRILRTLNPSPYMYYLDIEGLKVVGTSPELLVRVTDKCVETRPIAGTRPRGETKAEDIKHEQDLLADPKERSEHLMLVDLGRNDVGRVSKYGSVNVSQFMDIERYSHVMHIVSHVQGQLKDQLTPFDALEGCFPAGTVSGAPKVRAMEIIAELEKQSRGLYAGAIGYLGFSGNFDSCITIRTIVFENGSAYLQAGAGVVHDSDPELEYKETINKARALMKAIEKAEQVFYERVELNA
ncbi:anthranilate synthase component I [Desulfuribacillus alkaliarsenatis]|uniref:Anthranilate synthase component 1 n=1 Tax=Desulfuribacillus alkaliarsenatis TaxID=766136 RepID=A0A1E5G6I4_9FIRM|nr:anthranilate synthase component I [Desulfuribacillus alkaliarsenatis]OEF98715.1 anthranilate synthase component I [Desulfuribacillus alkaliarsenatis]